MIINKDNYVFTAVSSISNDVAVIIQDKDTGKVVDMCDVKLDYVNTVAEAINFSVISVYGRAEEIFEKSNVLPEIFKEIAMKYEEHLSEQVQTDS